MPRSDEFQNEYVDPSSERLCWISGFTGTAGWAIVGHDSAAIFLDGRYLLQGRKQALAAFWEHRHIVGQPPADWVKSHLKAGDRIGFDPRLHTTAQVAAHRAALDPLGVELVAVEPNLVDAVWHDRPAPPMGPVSLYPIQLAGETSQSKRQRVAADLSEAGLDALVISAADNLAWLFNIRGSDLDMTPFALGYGILSRDGSATMFMAAPKLSDAVRAELVGEGGIAIAGPEEFGAALGKLANRKVRLDRATGSVFIADRLEQAGATVDVGPDPTTAIKACKSAVELDGMRRAHLQDGVALLRFLHWFARTAPGQETEWTAAQQLLAFRQAGEHYRSPSFGTISAAGGNAAHPHYRLEEATARPLGPDEIYLVDSGAQYLGGTTDVTRVLVTGTPTAEMRRRYTQVLKGHIAVSRAHFPAGTAGGQLDPFARQFLWEAGVDFDHGTGHGVGCYLSVHEGPQSISKRAMEVSLKPGMVVSVEPGYYKPDAFGIRIENLVAVRELDPQPEGAELLTLGFETLTLAPYERRLIDLNLLTDSERAWIDAYHRIVRDALAPRLDAADAAFLDEATAPLA